MPSERRRRKDDTWTEDELNKAMKGGSRDDRRRGEGDRRRHGEDSERRRHKDDGDEKRSRGHKGRDRSPEVQLTEEDRERMRRERREKKEKGGKEKPRQKEMKPEKEVRIVDEEEDDRRRRHHRREEDDRRERKSRHREEEDRGHHRDDRHRERQHHDRDRDQDRARRHHGDNNNNDEEERRRQHHREKEKEKVSAASSSSSSRRRHEEDEDRDRHRRHRGDEGNRGDKHQQQQQQHTSSSRRHHRNEDNKDDDDDDNDRQRRHHNGSDRRRHRDEDEDEGERERQRQERRERRDREKQERDRGTERHREERDRGTERHREERDRERRSEKTSDRHRENRREDRGHDEDRHREGRDDHKDKEKSSRQKTSAPTPSFSVNGKHQEEEGEKQGDDDYNYEEDFEDYEDDFEDEEDPEMKEDGEMEEVLRALDEENNRLRTNSRRSNWSDSTELSDERFKDHREDEDRRPPKNVSRGKSFINFISAKQRVMDSTVASKARKRFTDLSKLIELDVASYDMFDLPPVGEYELYIRNFGRSDTKQAYVQTGDDDIEREVQTEEIESLSKWTQHPSDQDAVVGGEGIAVASSGESVQGHLASDSERLQKFLDRVGQFLFTILDEESISSNEEGRKSDGTPTASFSQSTSKLGFPDFLEGRQVKALSFCPSDPNSLLSIHSLPHEASKERQDLSEIRASSPISSEEQSTPFEHLYVLCIWNLSQMAYPFRICASEMMITCACFSPTKASLVFAGMYDGSVSLWDLREPAAQHKTLHHKDNSHVVRYPTYMTAGVLEAENHKSPVKAIAAVHSSVVGSLRDEETAESSSGLSFQLASVEEKSAVNLWVVAEIPVPDPAGSPNDLGLSPGGKIKLIRSSVILLNNPNKYLSYSQEIKALDLQLNPADLNHLYVTTDAGCVVHGVRFGKRAYPPAYSPLVASPVPMVTMDFSPFGQPYFLAGCQDGSLYLFHIRSEHPIAAWREFITGDAILSVRWSRSRPAVFFVLDNNSNVMTFDLVENGLSPIKSDSIRTADATCMEIGADPDLLTSTPGASRPAQMAFALDNGAIECLSVSDQMRKQQPLEEDFLASYIDRY